eukprot:Rmarinus@m.21888
MARTCPIRPAAPWTATLLAGSRGSLRAASTTAQSTTMPTARSSSRTRPSRRSSTPTRSPSRCGSMAMTRSPLLTPSSRAAPLRPSALSTPISPGAMATLTGMPGTTGPRTTASTIRCLPTNIRAGGTSWR